LKNDRHRPDLVQVGLADLLGNQGQDADAQADAQRQSPDDEFRIAKNLAPDFGHEDRVPAQADIFFPAQRVDQIEWETERSLQHGLAVGVFADRHAAAKVRGGEDESGKHGKEQPAQAQHAGDKNGKYLVRGSPDDPDLVLLGELQCEQRFVGAQGPQFQKQRLQAREHHQGGGQPGCPGQDGDADIGGQQSSVAALAE